MSPTLALVHDANILQSNPRTQLLLIVVSLLPHDYVLIYGSIFLRLLLTIQFTQAELEGIQLQRIEVVPRLGIGKAEYMAKFPMSMGKIPALEGPRVKLIETVAIAVVSARPETLPISSSPVLSIAQ